MRVLLELSHSSDIMQTVSLDIFYCFFLLTNDTLETFLKNDTQKRHLYDNIIASRSSSQQLESFLTCFFQAAKELSRAETAKKDDAEDLRREEEEEELWREEEEAEKETTKRRLPTMVNDNLLHKNKFYDLCKRISIHI